MENHNHQNQHNHFRRYGFFYLLIVAFLFSWGGQLYTSWEDIQGQGWDYFWSATFENWQSEFLQLAVQALGMVMFKDYIFSKANEG
ncbi:MAG TPA: hypothetical protein VJ742_01690 [Nitrososphaera sp.]|nr:hypothetical protein [Nitrososphaera sp.]